MRNRRRRTTHTGIIDAQAGCHDCDRGEARWYGKTALAQAARHCDATGHFTWAEQTIAVQYNRDDRHAPRTEAVPAQT